MFMVDMGTKHFIYLFYLPVHVKNRIGIYIYIYVCLFSNLKRVVLSDTMLSSHFQKHTKDHCQFIMIANKDLRSIYLLLAFTPPLVCIGDNYG